jgi:hypothetical protein
MRRPGAPRIRFQPMSRSPQCILAPEDLPAAPLILRRFVEGLEARRFSISPAAATRLIRSLVAGGPPGPDEAELVGRLVHAVLRPAGKGPLRMLAEAAAGWTAAKPRWARAERQLWWQGVQVKRWRHDAANQTAVLEAFEACGWPPSIPNPLPRGAGRDLKARRRETIRGLNVGLAAGTIRFYADGRGDGIRWAAVG